MGENGLNTVEKKRNTGSVSYSPIARFADISLFGLNIPFAIRIVLAGQMVISGTVLGRHMLALGENEETARLSGIRTRLIKLVRYTVSGRHWRSTGNSMYHALGIPPKESTMTSLTSSQRKYLRGLAHHLDPVVLVGKPGLSENLVQSALQALSAHELIKVRFNEFKNQKRALAQDLATRTGSQIAGIIGHVAILYRPQPDEEKRKITLPKG